MNLELSVVIACYNCENTIQRCLDSIPHGANVEVIVVDDNSTDKTATIIKAFIDGHPQEKIIYTLNCKNIGAGKTRNRGIELASKKYITFLDSDDEFCVNFRDEIKKLLENDYDCIIFDATIIFNTTVKALKMFYTQNLHEGVISKKEAVVFVRGATWGKIYKLDIIRENSIKFGSIQRNEDLIFTKAAVANCEKIYYLEKSLYNYIDNVESLMHNKLLLNEKNAFIAVETIKKELIKNNLLNEFNSIYFLEIVYSTTRTLILRGKTIKECSEHFNRVNKNYNKNDIYRKCYLKKYRIAYIFFRLGLFGLFRRLVEKYKC